MKGGSSVEACCDTGVDEAMAAGRVPENVGIK